VHLFTIGVYGFDEESFFSALQDADVDLLLDIRRRRGVRGPLYTFANAGRLQQELARHGIAYRHEIGLAPTEETRDLQRAADREGGEGQRRRETLAPEFAADYTRRTLDPFDWPALIAELGAFQRPALLCVERSPEACHRSLAAARLAELTGAPVTHLVP
jgi:uncharacterized protein (DUF488 family)